MAGKAPFIPPVIEDNPDGWGPCAIPTAFKDIPYQPFSKGDRLGKVKLPPFTFLQSLKMPRRVSVRFVLIFFPADVHFQFTFI